jgi:probable F420-dependent oxidoreductase
MRHGAFTFVNAEGISPVDLGVALEERGFDSLFVTEHSHIPVDRQTPFVSLTAAAVATESLLLGTGIALVAQRDPILTAKEVASLDLVSDGRFCFGVGVGWLREEIANHGVDPSVRGRVVDERLRAMIAIWTEEKAEFHGDFVDFNPIYSWPKPVTKPYPPLYLSGGVAGFRRIAELGTGWMSLSASAEAISGELEELRDLAGRVVPSDPLPCWRADGRSHRGLPRPWNRAPDGGTANRSPRSNAAEPR